MRPLRRDGVGQIEAVERRVQLHRVAIEDAAGAHMLVVVACKSFDGGDRRGFVDRRGDHLAGLGDAAGGGVAFAPADHAGGVEHAHRMILAPAAVFPAQPHAPFVDIDQGFGMFGGEQNGERVLAESHRHIQLILAVATATVALLRLLDPVL